MKIDNNSSVSDDLVAHQTKFKYIAFSAALKANQLMSDRLLSTNIVLTKRVDDMNSELEECKAKLANMDTNGLNNTIGILGSLLVDSNNKNSRLEDDISMKDATIRRLEKERNETHILVKKLYDSVPRRDTTIPKSISEISAAIYFSMAGPQGDPGLQDNIEVKKPTTTTGIFDRPDTYNCMKGPAGYPGSQGSIEAKKPTTTTSTSTILNNIHPSYAPSAANFGIKNKAYFWF